MNEPTKSVSVEISTADFADLEAWGRNSGHSVNELLQEALRQFMDYTRSEHAMFEEARKGPFSSLEDVEARLAEKRRAQAQAAE